tara:strand:- start:149 stop:919 length:771 start_codon:yes stop_codon:yes gene_type:complete
MKIQFIIAGFYFDKYSKGEYLKDLKYIDDENENISVFWSCHNEPPQSIKDDGNFILSENVGLEWGAYRKALDYLKLEDNTILFLMHDDLLIKDWSFVEKCIEMLDSGVKIIGNGANYPMTLDPHSKARLSYWLKTNDKWVDYTDENNKYFYDETLDIKSIRGSFICTKMGYLNGIGSLDYVKKGSPGIDTTVPDVDGVVGNARLESFGNTSLYLNAYKFTKIFGIDKIKYLSPYYCVSDYMVERIEEIDNPKYIGE